MSSIVELRKIVSAQKPGTLSGYTVSLLNAKILVNAFDQVSPETREKFLQLNPEQLIKTAETLLTIN
jgi:hypothetical protein